MFKPSDAKARSILQRNNDSLAAAISNIIQERDEAQDRIEELQQKILELEDEVSELRLILGEDGTLQ